MASDSSPGGNINGGNYLSLFFSQLPILDIQFAVLTFSILFATNFAGPSSPDDFTSSPIGNTLSSPGEGGRTTRRSQRATSSNTSTPLRSRLNPSSEARTPSSTGSRRRGGRRQGLTPSTPVAPTPASSEAGEGFDNDDAPPMYVWGTNISVQDVNGAILRFLRNFRDAPVDLESGEFEGKYMRSIRRVIEIEGDWLDVDAHHVFDYDPDLYNKMVRYPLEVLAIFDIVLMDIVAKVKPLFDKHVQVRIYNLKTSSCMRNLNPSGNLFLLKNELHFCVLILVITIKA